MRTPTLGYHDRVSGILVTGGAGFVGSHFVWAAVAAGRRVVVLDDLSGGDAAPLPPGTELVVGDIGATELIRRLLRDRRIGAVAHFAGKIQVGESVRRPELYFDVNLVRSLSLLEAVRDAGIGALMFSSSAAVYGAPDAVPIPETAPLRPANPYGATKLGVEHALEAYGVAHGLRWAALRYFNAAGARPDGTLSEAHRPETHLIPLALDAGLGRAPPLPVFGDDYPTPDGTCIRDYIHVSDLVDAHLAALLALEQGASVGAVNLGTGEGHSVAEVLTAAAEVLGAPVPHQIVPRRPGDPARLIADPTRAETLLGWRAQRRDLRLMLEDALRARR
jgi:UDP-glucose-4-epimerase GalE